MNPRDLTLMIGMPENPLPLAVAHETDELDFVETNAVFSAVFPGIRSPRELKALITSKTDNKTIITHQHSYWELLEVKMNPSFILFLVKNISFEILILQQLKKQLNDLTAIHKLFSDALEKELPIGIMIIDRQYNVHFSNQMLKRFFHIPSKVHFKKCYNYVKELKPCEDCIMEGIQNDKKKKKAFVLDDQRVVTAEIYPMEDKFMVTFRDTGKEINLIKEIKQQQDELEHANRVVAEQNEILKRLSNIYIRIGQMRDLDAILETVIDAIIATFSCKKGAVLLFNEAGKIKNAYFTRNIGKKEKKTIIRNIPDRETKSINITRTIVSPGKVSGENALNDFIIQDLRHKEKLMGRVFLSLPGKTLDQSILELFLMQVIVYLDNLELQRKLAEMIQKDSLTGVFNRYYFDTQFMEERDLSMRFGQPLSLILIDLNGLKAVNDSLGHEAGDRLLQRTAYLLRRNISVYDSIYRIGGDEFVILLSNCPADRMEITIDLLRKKQETASFEYEGITYPLRFCLGGACSTGTPHDRLKEEADKQMYNDKKNYYQTHDRYR